MLTIQSIPALWKRFITKSKMKPTSSLIVKIRRWTNRNYRVVEKLCETRSLVKSLAGQSLAQCPPTRSRAIKYTARTTNMIIVATLAISSRSSLVLESSHRSRICEYRSLKATSSAPSMLLLTEVREYPRSLSIQSVANRANHASTATMIPLQMRLMKKLLHRSWLEDKTLQKL